MFIAIAAHDFPFIETLVRMCEKGPKPQVVVITELPAEADLAMAVQDFGYGAMEQALLLEATIELVKLFRHVSSLFGSGCPNEKIVQNLKNTYAYTCRHENARYVRPP